MFGVPAGAPGRLKWGGYSGKLGAVLPMFEGKDLQILAFFFLVGVFEVLERVRPAREIDRWKDLKIDVFSFALAVTMNRFSHQTVAGFVEAHAPAFISGTLAALQSLPSALKILVAHASAMAAT